VNTCGGARRRNAAVGAPGHRGARFCLVGVCSLFCGYKNLFSNNRHPSGEDVREQATGAAISVTACRNPTSSEAPQKQRESLNSPTIKGSSRNSFLKHGPAAITSRNYDNPNMPSQSWHWLVIRLWDRECLLCSGPV